MHPPSVQLLRSMRTSLSTSNRAFGPARAALLQLSLKPAPVCWHLGSSKHYYSNDSSNASGGSGRHASRPSRIVHRPQPPKPQSHDRGPPSSEKTQTDFSELNVLGNIPTPATAIDACLDDGFHLDNGVKVTGGDGVLLVGGETFRWRPWEGFQGEVGDRKRQANMVNEKGQFDVPEEVWGLLALVWPRPDLLILGLGSSIFPISRETRKHINSLGIRIEVQDTRNAAAQFNLLATERGVTEVAAAMIPIGWKGR